MTARYLLMFLLIVSIGGCIPRQAKFAPVGAEEQFPTDQIWADWPSEWMTFRPAEKDEEANREGTLLLLSKDGFNLQTMKLTNVLWKWSSNIRRRSLRPACSLKKRRR